MSCRLNQGGSLADREQRTNHTLGGDMGWIKDTKAQARQDEAKRALEEGRTVYVCRINTPVTHHTMSGSMPGFAEQIEAVESLGWRLEHASFTQDAKSRPEGYFVFRATP
jgi:hypothetical protein